MQLGTFEKTLADAWQRKKKLLGRTQCLRLLNAEASGTPGLVFELFAGNAVLYDYGNPERHGWGLSLRAAASEWIRDFGWESVSLIDRTSAGDADRTGNHALAGEPAESVVAREDTLRFRLELRHPRNVGLFLDTRVLREHLHDSAEGTRVLNLFAYTGSLGLAALAGGAAAVTQVDISARYLDWGRENLRLNTLPEDSCRFSRMDSERYLDWALKKQRRFDRIILDPPVFSRFDGKVFRFADDYFRLAGKCAALLAPDGVLCAVTNYSGVRPAEFSMALERSLRDAGFNMPPARRVPLPEDYDLPDDAEDLPEGNAMIFQIARQ